jgi:UDP-glucuronate 4-epimerase
MKILVTGSAGFIGFHVARRLLADGHDVVGFDGLTDYYDVSLKRRRHAALAASKRFEPIAGMLEDKPLLERVVRDARPEIVVHLAAQAGVRYSLDHPDTYVSSNVVGTLNLLEALRTNKPRHLLVASTSSVYGGNRVQPFAEADRTDFPVSLYAATKKATEAMTHAYAQLFDIPTTCFRFFTVYGPWGRPDMALFKFVSAVENGEPIEVYGEGRMTRDFTYVDDLVEAICRLLPIEPSASVAVDPADSVSPTAPWRTVNLGGGHPVGLLDFIAAIERALDKPAIKLMRPMQPGDVSDTAADTALIKALIGYVPATSIDAGVKAFVEWFRAEYAPRQPIIERQLAATGT